MQCRHSLRALEWMAGRRLARLGSPSELGAHASRVLCRQAVGKFLFTEPLMARAMWKGNTDWMYSGLFLQSILA